MSGTECCLPASTCPISAPALLYSLYLNPGPPTPFPNTFIIIILTISCLISHSSAFHPDSSTPTSSLVPTKPAVGIMTLYQQPCRIQRHHYKVSPKYLVDRECSADVCATEHVGDVRRCSVTDEGSIWLSERTCSKNNSIYFPDLKFFLSHTFK